MSRGVLIDSNVWIDVTQPNNEHHAWSRARVRAAMLAGTARINPLIYAEVSAGFADEQTLDRFLQRAAVVREVLPYAAAFPAMRAFRENRKRGGKRTSPLPDSYIGAHAEAAGHTLLTRDAARFRTYFPEVELVTPDS